MLLTKKITYLDLRAITENVKAFESHLKSGSYLKLLEDNMAVVYIINTIKSKSREITVDLKRLHRLITQILVSIEWS